MKSGHGRNSVATNIIHLLYSTAFSSVLNATALIVLASYLDAHYYGLFSVALAMALIMAFFTDIGLSDIALREGSKIDANISDILSSYIRLRFWLVLVTLCIGFLVIYFTYQDQMDLLVASFCLITPMVIGVTLQSFGVTYFQLIEKMQYMGLIRIISAVLLFVSISIGMLLSLSPIILTTLYGMSYLIGGIFAAILVLRQIKISLKSKFHKGLYHKLGSFTLGGLLFVIIPQMGPLLLEKTVTLVEVGLFAVAYRIPQALQKLPFIVAGAYYPVLFRYYNQKKYDDHLDIHIKQVKIMSVLGMVMLLPLYYFSESIIRILFGEEWISATIPLKILSLMLLLQAVNIALADGLTSISRQNSRTIIQVIAVIVGIGLYLPFSAYWGVTGAAIAGVSVEVVMLIGFWGCLPSKIEMAKKALIPYVSSMFGSLLVFELIFKNYLWVGLIGNLVFVGIILYLDKAAFAKFVSFRIRLQSMI
ncbi:oligosaccharide flippase family protein [Bacillus sp. 2205SS5-2]|uniref:oligosaccharide flippase family protein n=1 Tax=Bacillus sp. 2205SS5-2 TaxID=3109031 RepID=UPI003006197D